MKKLIPLILFTLLLNSIFAQKENLYPFFKNGKMGYMNLQKEIVCKADYDTAYVFYKGHGVAKKDNSWYIINHDGSDIILNSVDSVAGPFHDFESFSPYFCLEHPGLSVLRRGKWIKMDLKGKEIYKSACEEEGFFSEFEEVYNPKKYVTQKNGKYGYQKNNIEIPIIYDKLIALLTRVPDTIMYNGIAYPKTKNVMLFVVKQDGKYGLLDENGEVLIKLEHSKYDNNSKHFFFSKGDDKWMKFEITGRKAWQQEYKIFNGIIDKFLIVSENGKFGLMDHNEKMVRPFINDEIYKLSFYDFAIERGDSTFVLDNNLKTKLAIEGHTNLKKIRGSNSYITKFKRKFGVINMDGETLVPHKFKSLKSLKSDQLFVFGKRKKQGVVSSEGNIILKAKYNQILNAFENCFLVSLKGNQFYVSYNGIEFR